MDLQSSIIENNIELFKILLDTYPLSSSTIDICCSLGKIDYIKYILGHKEFHSDLITESCIYSCFITDSIEIVKILLNCNIPVSINILKKCIEFEAMNCFAYFCELGFKSTCPKSKKYYEVYCNIHSSEGFIQNLNILKFYKKYVFNINELSITQKEKIFETIIIFDCPYDSIINHLPIDYELIFDYHRLDILSQINLDKIVNENIIIKALIVCLEMNHFDYFKIFAKYGLVTESILNSFKKHHKNDYFLELIQHVDLMDFRKYDILFFKLLEDYYYELIDMNLIFWRERLFIYERFFYKSESYKLYAVVKQARENYEESIKFIQNTNIIRDIQISIKNYV